MHAASSWLPAALGMFLLVLPSAGPTLDAAAQTRKTPETSGRLYQRPAPIPEAKQQIPICIVPELSDVDEVKRDLAARRLTLGPVHKVETDRRRAGTILKQFPTSASKVRCGLEVEIWVAVAPKPAPPKPNPPKPDPPKPDPPKPDPPKPDPLKPDSRRPDYSKPDYPRPDRVRPDYPKPDYPKLDPPKPDYPKPDYPKPDPPKPDYPKPDFPKPDPPKPDPPKPDAPKPNPPKPDPPPVTIGVPDLQGRDRSAATRMLEAVGLHLGEVGQRQSDGPEDTVVGQFPDAGSLARPGASVRVWLAVPRPATVPDLTGRDRAGAADSLAGTRLRLGLIGERESDAPKGTVVEQSPSAHTVVRPGMAVDVWLAVPVRVLVPDVRGRSQRSAGEALQIVRLLVGDVREIESTAPPGTVLNQFPAPDAQVIVGTSVSLSIAVPAARIAVVPPPAPVQPVPPVPSSPAPPVPTATATPPPVAPVRVPAVVGVPLAQAFVVLQRAGLRPGRVSEIRAAAETGTVTTQFPAAGTDALPGAQVDLIVAGSLGVPPWILSPWVFGGLAIFLIAVAGSLMRTKRTAGREIPAPSVSFAPHADPGMQSAVSADGVLTRSEFCLEARSDPGIQALQI